MSVIVGVRGMVRVRGGGVGGGGGWGGGGVPIITFMFPGT